MAQKTLFFVQPYTVRKHKLVACGAQTFVSSGEAMEAAAALSRLRAGLVVVSQTYDTAQHVLGRPTVMRVYGRVPQEWSGNLKAAA